MNYTPKTEGVDHINIYSKSKTYLGKFMSNFYKSSFHCESGTFASVEHWWFYQLTKNNKCLDATIKPYEIKKLMTEHIKANGVVGEIDRVKLKEIYRQKISNYSKGVLVNFLISDLPFTHYYTFGDKVVNAKEQFLVTIWTELRTEMKQELNLLFNKGFFSSSLHNEKWFDQNVPWKPPTDDSFQYNRQKTLELSFQEALMQAKNKQFDQKVDSLLDE